MRVEEVASQRVAAVSEGRLRNESYTEKKLPSTLVAPSEARFRLQEGNKSTMGQTASVRVPLATNNPVRAIAASSAPTNVAAKRAGLQEIENAEVRRSLTNLSSANPFEDEDDYDDSRNPFAGNSSNPFEEEDDYNDSLNPFSD